MRPKSFRIAQEQKKKKWAKKIVKYLMQSDDPVLIGIYAHSPARCSCSMCGNYRKHYGNSHPLKVSEIKRIPVMES